MKRLIGLIVLLAPLTGIAAGCAQTPPKNRSTSESVSSAPEEGGWPGAITDAAGHEVVLEKQPERITFLHTFYMEHFLLLGTPPTASSIDNALGQTEALQQSEMFGPFLKGVEIMNLGSTSEVNLETILESDPDVIVTFSTQGGLDKAYDQLVQIAPAVLLGYTSSWQDQLRDCAEIVGKEDEAQNMITEIEKTIADTKEAMALYADRTFALFRTDGKSSITRGNAAYYKASGTTKPRGYPDTYETVSLKVVAETNPYYIVFQHNHEAVAAFVKSMEASSVWQSIDAVKNGRIYYFDENMSTFGPLALRLTAEKLAETYSGQTWATTHEDRAQLSLIACTRFFLSTSIRTVPRRQPLIKQTNEPAQSVQDIQTIKVKGHAWAAWLIILFGGGVLILLMALSITERAAEIPLSTVWDVLLRLNRQDTYHLIVVDLRPPRVLASALAGTIFAVAGAVMQGVTRDPMADSGLMGLNADAGSVLSLCFTFSPGFSYLQFVLFSFAGAALGAGPVSDIAPLWRSGVSPMRLVLVGAAVNALLFTLSQGTALYFNVAQNIMFWTAGDVAGSTWPQIRIMAPWITDALLGAIVLSRPIPIMSLGEDITGGLGLNTLLVRALCTTAVLMLADASVAVIGPVGFVGLAVPHVARFLVGRDYRWIIPASAVLEDLLVVLADLGARMLNPPFEMPIGAVIALVGVLFFLYLARGERRAL